MLLHEAKEGPQRLRADVRGQPGIHTCNTQTRHREIRPYREAKGETLTLPKLSVSLCRVQRMQLCNTSKMVPRQQIQVLLNGLHGDELPTQSKLKLH